MMKEFSTAKKHVTKQHYVLTTGCIKFLENGLQGRIHSG